MSAPRLLAPTTISGGVPTAGAGTLNTIALWTPDGNTLGNSLLTQSGNIVTNASGAIRALGTTQTSPAFTRHDTTTSGIYFPATNEIGFTISSQHAMFISSGRNVGIGTVSPGYRLHVKDATNRNMIMTSGTTGMKITSLTDAGAEADIGVQGNTVQFLTGGTERARIDSAGNFGLGTSTLYTGTKLQVSGSGGVAAITSEDTNAGGNFLRWLADTTNQPLINWTTGSALRFATSTSAFGTFAEWMRITSTGNVGIGTASITPIAANYTTVSIRGSSGGGIQMGTAAAQSYLYGDAGRMELGTTPQIPLLFTTWTVPRMRISGAGATEAASQVAIGTGSFTTGRALTTVADLDVFGVRVGRGTNGVTGNTALGDGVFASGSLSGAYNVAVGYTTGAALTTGQRNTFLGGYASGSATTAQDTVSVGYASLYSVTTTSGNVAIGFEAGRYLSSGSATTQAADSVFVGRDARPSGDGESNQIVIGTAARGNGSNTTTIGTSATTRTVIPAGTLDLSTAATQGLKLPATPGNADTQTLDCYQEGTWSPTLTGFGGTTPTATIARYTRVGRLVTLHVLLTATGGNQFSSTAATTLLTLPSGMTPAADAAGSTSNSVIGADGPCVAYTNGNLYVPTFALRTANTILTVTYSV